MLIVYGATEMGEARFGIDNYIQKSGVNAILASGFRAYVERLDMRGKKLLTMGEWQGLWRAYLRKPAFRSVQR